MANGSILPASQETLMQFCSHLALTMVFQGNQLGSKLVTLMVASVSMVFKVTSWGVS